MKKMYKRKNSNCVVGDLIWTYPKISEDSKGAAYTMIPFKVMKVNKYYYIVKEISVETYFNIGKEF